MKIVESKVTLPNTVNVTVSAGSVGVACLPKASVPSDAFALVYKDRMDTAFLSILNVDRLNPNSHC